MSTDGTIEDEMIQLPATSRPTKQTYQINLPSLLMLSMRHRLCFGDQAEMEKCINAILHPYNVALMQCCIMQLIIKEVSYEVG